MAPIATAKATKHDNNNESHGSESKVATGNNRVRTAISREKAGAELAKSSSSSSRSSTTAMKKEEAPAKKTSARSSSSSSSSSRSYDTPVASKQQKPETITARARKDIKTPPSGNPTTTASAPAGIAAKATKTHPLPSAALHKHKQAAVFTSGKRKHKTNFGSAYDSGSIPCRINHGSIKNALQWTKAPETLDFNPLLITCVEGFQEVEHPFVFLARTAFKDLMNTPDAGENAIAVLPQVIPPLRIALMAKEDDIFLTALEATRILSDAVENEMNVYLPKLTQQIHRKLLTKQLRAEVEDTLATLERNGGKEALAIIRSKIPTYVSVN